MHKINIQDFLTDDTNLVNIHFINNNQDINVNKIDINTPLEISKKITDKYKVVKKTNYITYMKNKLSYTYDLTNDNQIVSSKFIRNHKLYDNIYCISYNYSKLPNYIFPCISNIDMVNEYTLTEYKITNRIAIIKKNDSHGEYFYIEYIHSPNVDLDKINYNINNILQ